MKKRKLTILVLVIVAIVIWKFCGSFEEAKPGDTKFLYERPWVTKLTDNPREPIHVLFFMKRQNFGATVHGSSYRHLINLVKHEVKNDRLGVTFLQDNVKIRSKVRTYECDAPGKLDLCLELDFRAKKFKFYSSKRWKQTEDVPASLRSQIEGIEEQAAAIPEDAGKDAAEGMPAFFRGLW